MSQHPRATGNRRILCVDDDAYLTDLLQYALTREGYVVQIVHSGKAAFQVCMRQRPDLVLLDLNLPDASGYELCRQLRDQLHLPVIILSGNHTDTEVIAGFDHGADDYITKPFSMHVLTYRIEAVLRRSAATDVPESRSKRLLRVHDGWFDTEQNLITRNSATIKLTTTESRIFQLLLNNEGQVLSAERILDAIWDIDSETNVSVIKTHIRYLRTKLSAVFESQQVIHTVRGIGYTYRHGQMPISPREEATG